MDDKCTTILNCIQKMNSTIDIISSKIQNTNNIILNYEIIIDINFYRNTNLDISHLCDVELLLHYYTFGKLEKRLSSEAIFTYVYPDFNIENYKKYNCDLQHMSDIQLKCHYFQHGHNESRKC